MMFRMSKELSKQMNVLQESAIGSLLSKTPGSIKNDAIRGLGIGDDSEVRKLSSASEAMKDLELGTVVVIAVGNGIFQQGFKKNGDRYDNWYSLSPDRERANQRSVTKTETRAQLSIELTQKRELYAIVQSQTAQEVQKQRSEAGLEAKYGTEEQRKERNEMATKWLRGEIIPIFRQKAKELVGIIDEIEAAGGEELSYQSGGSNDIYNRLRALSGGFSNAYDKLLRQADIWRGDKDWKQEVLKDLNKRKEYIEGVFRQK